jgi:5'(3')-deoxyribonucleotidase
MNKPTVLLDCDGILSDFTRAALELVFEVTGRRYAASSITTWEVFDSLAQEREYQHEVYRILKGTGGCLSIPVYESALEGVAKLRELADIVVVTSPFKGSPTWAHERELWLEKHFQLEQVIHARSKERVHGDFFVDDKSEHVSDWLNYWVRSGRDPEACGILWKTDRTTSDTRDPLAFEASDWAGLCAHVRRHARGVL